MSVVLAEGLIKVLPSNSSAKYLNKDTLEEL